MLDSDEEKRGQVAKFVENALVSLLKSGKLSIKKRRGRRAGLIFSTARRVRIEARPVSPPWASLRASLFRRSFRVSVSFPYFSSTTFFPERPFPVVFSTADAAGGGVLSTRFRRRAGRFVVSLYSSIAVMNFDFEKNNAARRLDREADALWENAKLRDEVKEYLDDSAFRRFGRLSVEEENEYLRETLAWEGAPIQPVADWLDATWRPLNLSSASETEVLSALLDLLERLRRLNHEIWRADHLSDRRLYELIVRRILPCKLKRLTSPRSPNVWNFEFYTETELLDASDESNWLTYYATPEERLLWSQEHNVALPQRKTPPFARRFPPLDGGCGDCGDCR